MDIIEFISQPWPWWVAGPMITLTMFLLLYLGKEFGVSDTLRTMCAVGGGGRFADFFRYEWKNQIWNIVFVTGSVIGGFIAGQWLMNPDPIALNPATIERLQSYGLENAGEGYLPVDIFNWESLLTARGFIMMIVGGFLIGFGTRYAGGCTSGHAISGLSNLQIPSFIAVIGFFIGGLAMTYLILPYILAL
jgi:Predicted transporter component